MLTTLTPLLVSSEGVGEPKSGTKAVELDKILFAVCWLHAIVMERLRFVPLGWSKAYEFNNSDLMAALRLVTDWVQRIANGRSNVAPSKIPWEAIRGLLSRTVYGGRIDDEFDQRVLNSLIDRVMNVRLFDDFVLVDAASAVANHQDEKMVGVESLKALVGPSGTKLSQFIEWCQTLPQKQSPTWLGLAVDSEKTLAILQGVKMFQQWRLLQSSDNIVELLVRDAPAASAPSSSSATSALKTSCERWLLSMRELSDIVEVEGDALTRHFQREIEFGRVLVTLVVADLKQVVEYLSGSSTTTNHLKSILTSLRQGFYFLNEMTIINQVFAVLNQLKTIDILKTPSPPPG